MCELLVPAARRPQAKCFLLTLDRRGGARQRGAMNPNERSAFSFLQEAPTLGSLGLLNDRFAATIELFGYRFFGCMHYASPGRPFQPRMLFGRSSGEWSVFYVRNQLALHDPTVGQIFARSSSFSWADVQSGDLRPQEAEVFSQASKAGQRSGFLVPVSGSYGDVVGVIMTSDAILEHDPAERATLTAIATVYASYGNSLLEISQDQPTATPLTSRECQCLSWASQGKTDWEIGRILGIAPRTVGTHIDNARAKLGASNRTRAVFEAWRHGWLIGSEEEHDRYGKSRIH